MKGKRRTKYTLWRMKTRLKAAKKRRVLTIGKDCERIQNKIIITKAAAIKTSGATIEIYI